jgi:CRISP-associated protein Cas1
LELVLSTFGTSLNIDNDGFVVTQGKERQRIPVEGVSSIQISKGASITSDAALLAIANEIPVIFVNRTGRPEGRIWSPRYGSISTIRKGQLAFAQSKKAVTWICSSIERKISNQQALLMAMTTQPDDMPGIERDVHRLDVYRNKVLALEGDRVADIASALRGYEGAAARIYFMALNRFLPEPLRFAERSQHPARDPVNAMLNYGYGILYSKCEGALIMAGADPYIGILHRDEHSRPVLAYDLVEVFRFWIDYVVYHIACQNVLNAGYYSMRSDGSCWLETLGRRVLIQSVNDYLDEVVEMNGASRSRDTHIKLYAQSLAQTFRQLC